MPNIQDLSTITLALKAQSGYGVPASGSGGTGILCLPSGGLQAQVSAIESAMIRTSRMRSRQRQGGRSATASYETELSVGALDDVFEGALGGTWVAAQDFTQADFTSLAISGTGTTITAGSGSFLTEGFVAGQMLTLASMATTGNNAVATPILAVTASTLTIPSGYLVDETADTSFTLTLHRHLFTTTPYVDRYFTVEEVWTELDTSKVGSDMRFNALNLSIQPNAYTKVGWGFGGPNLSVKTVGDSPVLTSPTTVSAESLIVLDGGIYVNGTKRSNLTGVTMGITAPVESIPLIGTVAATDVTLGQFAFTGQVTGAVEDATDFAAFDADTPLSMFLHHKEADTEAFVSIYAGRLSFGGYASPMGGAGALIQTMNLFGGEDDRGAGYAPSTFVVSTSAV